MSQVVGVQHGIIKKSETDFTILHIVSDFDEFEGKNAEGHKAENVFIRGDLDVHIGEEIELVYGVGFAGKAVVKGITKIEVA